MTEMQMKEYALEGATRLQKRADKCLAEIDDIMNTTRECISYSDTLLDIVNGISTLTHEEKLDALREGSIDV